MLKRAFLSLQISKFSGEACLQTHLAARAFGAQNLPRLVPKSGQGPENRMILKKSSQKHEPHDPETKLPAIFLSLSRELIYLSLNMTV